MPGWKAQVMKDQVVLLKERGRASALGCDTLIKVKNVS